MLKFVCVLPNGALKKVLKRLRLYHPSLHRLMELSRGDKESLLSRSKEFSGLLQDLLINGVWKYTNPGRLAGLDEWVASILPRFSSQPFRMLDVGGSDGSTTFDTINYFKKKCGLGVKAYILDMQLRLHCFRRGYLWYYLTYCHSPLLIQIGPLGILFEEIKSKEGVVFNLIVRVIRKCMQRFSLEKYMNNYGDLLLENPLARNNSDIIWLEQDLFQFDPALKGSFDFIRCSNVLNDCYFSQARIYDALRLLAIYLKPGGLLLVSRTIEDSTGFLNHASLWVKNGEGLQHLSDLNGGSEVKKFMQVSADPL